MKKLATLLCLMVGACLHAFAQTNIDVIEYFFDSDPGFGNGTTIGFSPVSNIDTDININTSGLSIGFHTLVIRAKNVSGDWSIADYRVVYVASESVATTANVGAIEYYIDTDPGPGNGTDIPITASSSLDIFPSIPTASLAPGFHVLHIRARDNNGNWGIPDARPFYVVAGNVVALDNIIQLEYYIDTDPGPGNGTDVPITASTLLDIFPTIPTASLAPGFHVFHIRARDNDGNWGIPDARPFYIVAGNVVAQDNIIQLEFFFDTEPGYGAGTALAITSSTQIDIPALVSSASLSNGFHTISIRAKDENDQWGFAETRTFYVDEFRQVSAIEYYIDTDPGEGSATAVSVTTGGEIDVDITIPTGSLSGGSHTLGIRAARTDGSWGNTTTSSFSVQDSQTITFQALTPATYGDPPFTLSGTSSSGLSLSYTSSDPLVATIAGSTVTIVGGGTTTITASQTGDGTYAPAPDVTQTLTINKATQTISFAALSPKTMGDPAFILSATSSSTLNISYSSSNTAVATISGNAVTIVGAGSTNITASQPGNGNYLGATDVVQPLVVLPASNPPAISTQTGAAFFVNTPVAIHSTITITDVDDELTSATVSITSGFQAAEDQLLFTPLNLLTGTFDATTGVLTISGPGSVPEYQGALRSVQYRNTSPTPSTGDRTISFRISDGSTNSNVVTATITINKPPAIEAPERETQAGGNIVFLVNEILSDPDNNLDLSTLRIISSQGADITIEGNIITINYSSKPDYYGADELTVTICDLGGKCQTQVVTVDIGAGVEVFNGISANGDDMNAYFRVRFLPALSRVVIFNRWGDIIYDNPDYDTSDPSKRFQGVSDAGNELTTGTYYYKITLPDGQNYTGYLHLKR